MWHADPELMLLETSRLQRTVINAEIERILKALREEEAQWPLTPARQQLPASENSRLG